MARKRKAIKNIDDRPTKQVEQSKSEQKELIEERRDPAELPQDIFVSIMLFLEAHDTLSCLLVNKEWKRCTSAQLIWKRLFEAFRKKVELEQKLKKEKDPFLLIDPLEQLLQQLPWNRDKQPIEDWKNYFFQQNIRYKVFGIDWLQYRNCYSHSLSDRAMCYFCGENIATVFRKAIRLKGKQSKPFVHGGCDLLISGQINIKRGLYNTFRGITDEDADIIKDVVEWCQNGMKGSDVPAKFGIPLDEEEIKSLKLQYENIDQYLRDAERENAKIRKQLLTFK